LEKFEREMDDSLMLKGLLLEYFVLTEIIVRLQTWRIQYWCNKRGHEIDFIYSPRGADPIAIISYKLYPNGFGLFQ